MDGAVLDHLAPFFFLFVPLLLVCAGCSHSDGPATYPVRGIVRFPDGQVLRDGSVEFQITGVKKPVTARGAINPDGSFQLGTFDVADGALAGKHQVVVISYHLIGNGAERPGMIPQATLDPKFSSYRTSGLIREVKAVENEFIIEVDYADNSKQSSKASDKAKD